ncbi:MAG: hypothetical protein A3H98_00695 [Bacteroidetes bacterium RIFCSPLOWO2_02_FULL_36_8]|nr:MAG: hypothetical protein A3H98_00695 [Bacteroidetes bacterium RIFCSPLOWO2_02_FULL_36_8]OFY68732.1 MAG: hypothetical protein A3G23_02755 [Bacteroidetes bacterium RIFCSPLOWO2_12_FULL_37_12]
MKTHFSVPLFLLSFHFSLFTFHFSISISHAQTVKWSVFTDSIVTLSSPRTVDLNKDGVLDIVVGAGTEGQGNFFNVCAFDGKNGARLWNAYMRDECYGTAVFQDITGDSIPDVFIGGRQADFRALDGSNGNVIWRFFPEGDTDIAGDYGWYNFYTSQLIPDQNNDGFKDILQANGGDGTKLPQDTIRPPGCIMVFDAKTGDVLTKVTVPDSHEVYCSPLLIDFLHDGNYQVIYGTGGETIRGSLWKVTLKDLMNGDLSASVNIVTSATKGFIAPPSLTDLNGDNILDIIVASFDGNLIAVDGKTNLELWRVTIPEGETYSSPAIGLFNSDTIPDVFINFGIGVYPYYPKFRQFMVDGANGNVLFEDSIGIYQLMSPIAVDYNNDGTDDIIFTDNKMNLKAMHDILVLDFKNNARTELFKNRPGASIITTPWVGDLDNDDTLDLIFTYTPDTSEIWVVDKGWTIERIDLQKSVPPRIAFGAYLGTNYDGIYDNTNLTIYIIESYKNNGFTFYPNPAYNKINFLMPENGSGAYIISVYDVTGIKISEDKVTNTNTSFSIHDLSSGIYFIEFLSEEKPNLKYRQKLVIGH